MGKLRVMSGRQAAALLQANGFAFARQSGSHMVYKLTTPQGSRSVTVPNHRELKSGTLLGIIEQSGLPRELFETL